VTTELPGAIEDLTADFAGVVSVSRGDTVEFEQAYGLADRAHHLSARPDTRFAIASGTKAFTALTVISLIVDGKLALDTTARSLLGADLPLIADEVSVEQLLTHRSGIGDYVDEDADEELPLKVPVQDLDTTEHYLPALDGFPTKFSAGSRFSYCNSGYVVLALLAERASGAPFHDLVEQRVFARGGMSDTGFPRSDQLPERTATGYLDDGRTNVFAVPVRGNGDGGAYTTVADVRAFWRALAAGAIVPADWAKRMITSQTDAPGRRLRYGWGLWLADSGSTVWLDGCDHGVSFRSLHDPGSGLTATVASNTTDGAWPVVRRLGELLF
jgi:CubicO group peptidase (beta-lactamase class C family)